MVLVQDVTSNLIFSLNATVPVFLMMVFGWCMQKAGLLDEHTTQKVNQFVFRALLPALLFMDLSTAGFPESMGHQVRALLLLCHSVQHRHCLSLLAAA